MALTARTDQTVVANVDMNGGHRIYYPNRRKSGVEACSSKGSMSCHCRGNSCSPRTMPFMRILNSTRGSNMSQGGLASDFRTAALQPNGVHKEAQRWFARGRLTRPLSLGTVSRNSRGPTEVAWRLAEQSFASGQYASALRACGSAKTDETKSTKLLAAAREYVNVQRIAALKRLPTTQFDVAKLVRMCEELNFCFAHNCCLAMIMLTRAIIDHVPPVFSAKNFAEVANNYACGRSFKEAMVRLDTSSRNLADSYLHTQIRKRESLPNITQVDFSNDLDVLLAEVERVLK